MERKTLSIREAAKILGIGRNQMYAAVKRGEIPAIQVGCRYYISRVALERLLETGTNITLAG